ncbi:MAG: hypothetical protein IBX55_00625 [Methyloprofundus sp.]|nr:hypothetical protein [Methyloprofundus sp.]
MFELSDTENYIRIGFVLVVSVLVVFFYLSILKRTLVWMNSHLQQGREGSNSLDDPSNNIVDFQYDPDKGETTLTFDNDKHLFLYLSHGGTIRPNNKQSEDNKNEWASLDGNDNLVLLESGLPAKVDNLSSKFWLRTI